MCHPCSGDWGIALGKGAFMTTSKALTSTAKELVSIILEKLFINNGINDIPEIYPGITLEEITDDHDVRLAITIKSEFFKPLGNTLAYSDVMTYHKEIAKLGYEDCLSDDIPEKPALSNIFLSKYCSGLSWYRCGVAVAVHVDGIYIDFDEINRTILKLQQAEKYGFKLDTSKFMEKLQEKISNGIYNLNEDEYI